MASASLFSKTLRMNGATVSRAAIRALAATPASGGKCSANNVHRQSSRQSPLRIPKRSFHECPRLQKYLEIGDSASITKTITMEDVRTFAEVTLDKNPIHVDAEFAATTRFRKPIVHGIFSVSILGGIVGNTLPGPGCVLMGMDMDFSAPMFVDESVTVEASVGHFEGRRVTINFTCKNTDSGALLSRGRAYILAPKHKIRPVEEMSPAKAVAN